MKARPRKQDCLRGRCSWHPKLSEVGGLLEDDKRATTNVQNGLVFFFLFSFIIFSYLWTKTVVKLLNSTKKSWGKKCEKVPKSAKECEKVPNDFAL